jgi:hypothetical protein
MAGFILLRTVTPHSGNFICGHCRRSRCFLLSLHHSRHPRLKTRRCRSPYRSAMHQSMCRSLTSTDMAEDQCWVFLLVDCVAKKPKFPEEKNCEEYCSVSEIFCKNVARVK